MVARIHAHPVCAHDASAGRNSAACRACPARLEPNAARASHGGANFPAAARAGGPDSATVAAAAAAATQTYGHRAIEPPSSCFGNAGIARSSAADAADHTRPADLVADTDSGLSSAFAHGIADPHHFFGLVGFTGFRCRRGCLSQ